MYITRGMEVGHPKCLQMRTGGEGYQASCVHTHLHHFFSYFFMFFRVSVLHQYLQTLLYTIVIVAVTVILCYWCRSLLTKTQNFQKNRNTQGALSGLRQFLAN